MENVFHKVLVLSPKKLRQQFSQYSKSEYRFQKFHRHNLQPIEVASVPQNLFKVIEKVKSLSDNGTMRKTYPSDLSGKQFEQIQPLLESARKRTSPRKVELYEIFCAVLYVLKSGCQWRMLPEKNRLAWSERTLDAMPLQVC